MVATSGPPASCRPAMQRLFHQAQMFARNSLWQNIVGKTSQSQYQYKIQNNTIKAGGSTKRAQNVGLDWSGWMDGWIPLDCYDY